VEGAVTVNGANGWPMRASTLSKKDPAPSPAHALRILTKRQMLFL